MRQILIIGVLLMALSGLGMATWRLWADPGTVSIGASDPGWMLEGSSQGWLISATGGPVPVAEARAYLDHEDLIPERALAVSLVAPLSDLLVEGETMPDPAYFEVMADVRAPVLAERLCPMLAASLGARCAISAAEVVKGSVNVVSSTAAFRLEISYSQKLNPDELPDLARFFFATRTVELAGGEPVATGDRVEPALTALLDAAHAACAAEDAGQACRVLRLSLNFAPGRPAAGQAVIGGLFPLPRSMRPAPELIPAPGG